MTNTDTVDFKALINTGLPWKMVAKGSKSLTRRTKKQVTRAAMLDTEAECKSLAVTAAEEDSDAAPDTEAECKSSVGTVAEGDSAAASDTEAECKSLVGTAAEGDSEREKLGVSVLGQNLAERVAHVPIKKRRFIVHSPSPLNRSSSRGAQINHALPVSRLNPNLIGRKSADVSDYKPDCDSQDFSGIKILADVACCSDSAIVDGQPVESVQQQDALTLSAHVEGNNSSTTNVDVSGKYTMIDTSDKVGEGKSEIIMPPKVLVDTLGNASTAYQSEEHSIGKSSGTIVTQNISNAVSNESSTERPKENMEAGDSGNLATQSESITVSEIVSGDTRSEKGKNTKRITNDRLLWDLNLPTDVWGQPCDIVDEASHRYSDGEVTESVTESVQIDGSKDYTAGLIASDVYMNSPSPFRPKAETATRNGNECQSGYDSQFEDGELREPQPWEENEGDCGDVEQVDYGSEPENDHLYFLAESHEKKLEDVEKGISTDTKCESGNLHCDIEKHVVICGNGSHSKGSSPPRSFESKPFKEFPSHERRRRASYKEFAGRGRSPGNRDSERRFSPPSDPYGFGCTHLKTVEQDKVMMNGFERSGPVPHGVRRQFSNGGYRGRFKRFSDSDRNRDFRGEDRSFSSGDVNYRHVFRRLHDPQSQSRSSPVSWNRENRSPSGFKDNEKRMERVRLPFQKQFLLHEEMGIMSSSPRNQRNSRYFNGRNNEFLEENDHNNLRGRKSPSRRIFRPQQRFDNMKRVNSKNSNFRPFMRFNNRSYVDDGGSRGEEEKKMYRPRPPRRRVEVMEKDGDNIRRFRLNAEEQHYNNNEAL